MRALVVDDHPLIQEAVSRVLQRAEPRFAVEAAGGCERGLEIAAEGDEPALVLLDMHLPGGLSGIPALRTWRSRFPSVPVIVLSASSDAQAVLAALDAGAAGFIPKSSTNEVMIHAIRLVLDGGRYLPQEVLRAGPADAAAKPRGRAATSLESLGLTGRQFDVLRLIARGAPNKVICRELGLAERTVKAHVTAVLRALKVSSRTQAALAAARLGLGPD
jgi:DNA-binding NarL/FixJ family response regulator